MSKIAAALWMDLFPCACTVLGAAVVLLTGGRERARLRKGVLGLAAGVMLAVSVFGLLEPAIQEAAQQGQKGWLTASAGLVLGAVFLMLTEQLAGSLLQSGGSLVPLAMAIHNLPQGMAVGLSGALALEGQAGWVAGAVGLSLGIGVQNLPEGAAVSLAARAAGAPRQKAFAKGAASALVEPLGALLAGMLAEYLIRAMPWLLSLAAGTMVCVTVQELLPQAGGDREGTFCVVLGFAGMMALELLL